MPPPKTRKVPKPVDFPMTPLAITGTLLWLLAAGVLWLFTDELAATGRSWWLDCALAGAIMGIPGTITMMVHDRGRRRRARAQS